MENLKPNLAKAIIAVMLKVKGIDKTMTVGTGNSSYKGVSDQVVKQILGEAMAENGLCVIPIDVDARAQVERWEEVDQYSKETPKATKSKQSIFTEVKTKYLLMHDSGESIEISGYGHGVDSQDKGAGKATTYALKYALLYTFLVPTGKIDDADKNHSDEYEAPKKQPVKTDNRPAITPALLSKAIDRIKAGELDVYQKTIDAFKFSQLALTQLETAFTAANLERV